MHKKVSSKVRIFVRSFWAVVLVVVISLAVAVQLGRAAFPVLNDYSGVVEAFVSRQVGADVTFDVFEADWRGLTPEVSITGLHVAQNGVEVFSAQHLELQWSLLDTLTDWRLGLRKLRFSGLEAEFVQSPLGRWSLAGFPDAGLLDRKKSDKPIIDDPVDIFIFGRRLELMDTRLGLTFRSGSQADVTVPEIVLENDNRFHRLVAELAVDGEQALKLVVEGNGDPRHEKTFIPKGFVQSQGFSGNKIIDALEQSGLIVEGSQLKGMLPEDGKVNLEIWFNGTKRRGVSVTGRVNIGRIGVGENSTVTWPDSVYTEFRGYWSPGNGWRLSLNRARANWPDMHTPHTPIVIKASPEKPIEFFAKDVDIAAWSRALTRFNLLPQAANNMLEALSPKGIITSAQVQLRPAEQGYFRLQAQLEGGEISPWKGVPGMQGVAGFVDSNAFDGHIILDDAPGFGMAFPKLYSQPIRFKTATGDVRWTVYKDQQWVGLSSGDVTLQGADFVGRGDFNLRLPFKSSPGNEPEMTLSVGVEAAKVNYHKTFVPKTLPKSLYDWLGRSVLGGMGENIAFIYHGSLASEPELARAVQFFAHVTDGELAFDPQWPAMKKVNADLLVDDDNTYIWGLNASLYDNYLSASSVILKSYKDGERYLNIRGNAEGESSQLLKLLLNSPVQQRLESSMSEWQMSGRYSGDVDLNIPLSDKKNPEQNITVTLKDNSLAIPQPNLNFAKLNGTLTYSDAHGLNGEGVKAQLWQRPMVASVSTSLSPQAPALTISFDTEVALKDLHRWVGRPELSFAEGVTDVGGSVTFPFGTDKSAVVEAKSNLRGVKFLMPAPFDKSANKKMSLAYKHVRDSAPAGEPVSSESWVKLGSQTRVHWRDNGLGLEAMTLAVGGSSDHIKAGKIQVHGQLPHMDAVQWYDLIQLYVDKLEVFEQQGPAAESRAGVGLEGEGLEQQSRVRNSANSSAPLKGASQSGSSQGLLPIVVALQVESLSVGDTRFADMTIAANKDDQRWIFEFESEQTAGNSRVFLDQRPMEVDLKHLYLPSDSQANSTAVEAPAQAPEVEPLATDSDEYFAQSAFSDLDLSTLYPVNFKVADFRLGERSLGQWRFKLRPSFGGAIAYDVRANMNGLAIEGRAGRGADLVWLRGDGVNRTHFSAMAKGENVSGAILGLTGEDVLSSKSVNMDIQIEWPGAPDQLDIENIEGVVKLDMTRGHFKRGATAGENPLLKLMGLLNFDTLARRLRLDFSDLRQEGMAYESVNGEFLFTESTIKIVEPLQVDTPSSQLQLVGDIYLASETIDAQLVATLPIAGNLTAAAVLTGGIPVAIGVFILGKLFKTQFNKASSLRYTVEGTWADPEVKFDRVFDDTIQAKPATAD